MELVHIEPINNKHTPCKLAIAAAEQKRFGENKTRKKCFALTLRLQSIFKSELMLSKKFIRFVTLYKMLWKEQLY